MGNMNNKTTIPTQILYTMLRVSELERSVAFYCKALGMHELRRENFTEGRFTLVFIGYDNEASTAAIELTWNWDTDNYDHGTAYGHIALEVADIYAACVRLNHMGVSIIREPGPMTYPADETGHSEEIAFIKDPDGYLIELIQTTNR